MANAFEKKKKESSQLVVHKDIREVTYNMGTNLTNEKPEEYNIPSEYDNTGQSKVYYAEWFPNGGRVQIICYDFAKHTNIQSGLDVSMRSEEFQNWLNRG